MPDDWDFFEDKEEEPESTEDYIKKSVETHVETKIKAYEEVIKKDEVVPKKKPIKKVKKEKPKKFKAMIKRGKITEVTAEERFDYKKVGIDTLRGLKFFTIGVTDKEKDKPKIAQEVKELLYNPAYLGNFLENLAIFLKSIPQQQ